MKNSIFDKILYEINLKLSVLQDFGREISRELIDEKVDSVAYEYLKTYEIEIPQLDTKRLKFQLGNIYSVRVGEQAITLSNPDLPRWFTSKKAKIDWMHWESYKSMLNAQGRPKEIISANELVIDDVLDFSGDPTTPGPWSRKGLVMGNVQSGKTQNYIGLINKAIDCGYKTIILLGGHLNDLRQQTQERVDEGVLGRESRHCVEVLNKVPVPIGVGMFRENNINTGTTTIGDFNKSFAGRLGFKLTGEDPVIFTVKKQAVVLERLYQWIKDLHYLDPSNGKKLAGPLLLIDDEADYASINTKHHKEEVTKTNERIRDLLSLFNRNTYVGYTATPFANIFIDPDENAYSENSDLFPSDFMIKMPVPDNYMGQDFYFGSERENDDFSNPHQTSSPTVPIYDHFPIFELKASDSISRLPESLKEAFRAFVLTIAIRSKRGEEYSHNTMLVNISHLKIHQNKLEFLLNEYKEELVEAIDSFLKLGFVECRENSTLRDVENTFLKTFSVPESYESVFEWLDASIGKIKVWAINQGNKKAENKVLNYSVHKENGLCAVVIGGHKLSRGLTLEGLSISYFARNSKAYDTLMQMCRWFGYRPNYGDLCKVYLPQESIDWYSFISSAIRELYQELDLMSRREQRPSEFGLKVREHPGAMIITAKNKMGASESETRSQDLWGQVQRRFRFRSDNEVNIKNLEYAKKFFIQLLANRKDSEKFSVDDSGSIILLDVTYNEIVDFIENIDLPEDDLGNKALINHLKKMRTAKLGLPRVVLYNQRGRGASRWEANLPSLDREFIETDYKFTDDINLVLPKRMMEAKIGEFKTKSVHLGNRDDEKLFLSTTERLAVTNLVKRKAVSFDYICSDSRDYPGLIIYLFAVAVKPSGRDGPITLGHGRIPTLGYTVSIPRSENLKGLSSTEIKKIIKGTKHSYQVNKVHSQLQELSAYEEYDDDE